MPCVDKLNPESSGFQVVVPKNIGTEARADSGVVRYVIIQGKADSSDFELPPHVSAIQLRLKAVLVKQIQRAIEGGGEIMGQVCFD